MAAILSLCFIAIVNSRPFVNVSPCIEMCHTGIPLESESKIDVKLGKLTKEGKFRIKNTSGKFRNISIYPDSELEESE